MAANCVLFTWEKWKEKMKKWNFRFVDDKLSIFAMSTSKWSEKVIRLLSPFAIVRTIHLTTRPYYVHENMQWFNSIISHQCYSTKLLLLVFSVSEWEINHLWLLRISTQSRVHWHHTNIQTPLSSNRERLCVMSANILCSSMHTFPVIIRRWVAMVHREQRQ